MSDGVSVTATVTEVKQLSAIRKKPQTRPSVYPLTFFCVFLFFPFFFFSFSFFFLIPVCTAYFPPGIAVQAIRFARVCVEEAMKHAFKRSTFGKKLIEHPVIRFKLAQMARQVEASHAWAAYLTFQLTQLDHEQQNVLLGGPIALLKAQSTFVFEFCAREAAQIFGGLAYTRGGQGQITWRTPNVCMRAYMHA